MKNILIKINSSLITFSLVNYSDNTNINNTNIIDTKEMIFSYDYVKNNIELVNSFIRVICLKNKVNKLRVNEMNLVSLTLKIINNINTITQLYIKEEKPLNYEVFMSLLDNNNLEYLNCYDCPTFLLERLDINKKLKIELRCEVFFVSKFITDNKLEKYSDIFYKKSLIFNDNLDPTGIEDLRTILNINKYLETIHIKKYSNELIYTIIDLFKELNISDKIIVFYEHNNVTIIVNSINYLKTIYSGFLENNNINFKIVYSKEYKRKNFFKQLNFVTLKYVCFVIIICAILFSGLDYYKNYKGEQKLNSINNKLTDILDNFEYTNIDEQTNDVEIVDTEEAEEQNNTNTSSSNYVNPYYQTYSQMFEELSNLNSDTIGWLTVNNTKVNYPVVQYTDNDYYLKHDYNKSSNILGWIFMDYRNNIYNMSQNTIIYGHNLKNGTMFGSLRYTMNESWYKKSENQIITFNSKVKQMKWKIFSIYKIPVSSDYLYANFGEESEYIDFINYIKSRSIYDFGIEVKGSDYILTLSTCQNHTQRLVIHAVLLQE